MPYPPRHIRNYYLSNSKRFQDGNGNGNSEEINSNDLSSSRLEPLPDRNPSDIQPPYDFAASSTLSCNKGTSIKVLDQTASWCRSVANLLVAMKKGSTLLRQLSGSGGLGPPIALYPNNPITSSNHTTFSHVPSWPK